MPQRILDLYLRPLPEAPAVISGGILLKGGIMLMGGEAKIGKTMLGLDLAHNLGIGGPLWGTQNYVVEPTPTLYCDQELGPYGFQERVKKRYDTLGLPPPDNLFWMSKTPGFYLDTGPGISILKEAIRDTGARVVILDPISRCMMGDENSNTAVNQLFLRLDELMAEFTGLSVVMLHHFGKPPKGDAADDWDPFSAYNFRGAAKWFDAPDTLVTFRRSEGLPGELWRIRAGWELRHAPKPEERTQLAVMEGGLIQQVTQEAVGAAAPKSRWRTR